MNSTPQHIEYDAMQRALQLARYGLYTSTPNPRVGAVVLQHDRIVGEGWHHCPGKPHAEVLALQDARNHGINTIGSTVVVTLEPCCHQGRTPPCTDALINAKVAKVIFALQDPNPLIAGKGIAKLRQHDITVVDLGSTDRTIAKAAFDLNPGFITRHQYNRPWVQAKMAMSLDGRTAMPNGHSQWITGESSRQDGQYWRARSCAIITGIGTALIDNPRLSVRNPPPLNNHAVPTTEYRQPLKVVLDRFTRLPKSAIMLHTGSTLQIGLKSSSPLTPSRSTAPTKSTQTPTVKYWQAPEYHGHIDLAKVLQELVQHDCFEVLLEAGPTLTGAFIEQGLVDQWIFYIAPRFLGSSAYPLVRFNKTFDLQHKWSMYLYDRAFFGEDIRLIYRNKSKNDC